MTHPRRLTLSKGTIAHDASFQTIDEHKAHQRLESGRDEFVDSYQDNIAPNRLAELLGVEDMVPVYAERKWKGQTGSLSWWLPVMMGDAESMEKKIEARDKDKWNNQMYRIQVFERACLRHRPNLTNVLIGEDWTLWRIVGRAFRTIENLRSPSNLAKCDWQLEKMKALTADELAEKTKNYTR